MLALPRAVKNLQRLPSLDSRTKAGTVQHRHRHTVLPTAAGKTNDGTTYHRPCERVFLIWAFQYYLKFSSSCSDSRQSLNWKWHALVPSSSSWLSRLFSGVFFLLQNIVLELVSLSCHGCSGAVSRKLSGLFSSCFSRVVTVVLELFLVSCHGCYGVVSRKLLRLFSTCFS